MPIREPHRTEYIDKLYKEKNVDGLQKELQNINCVIEQLSKDLLNAMTMHQKEKYINDVDYEKKTREKIEKYLFDLLNNNESN